MIALMPLAASANEGRDDGLRFGLSASTSVRVEHEEDRAERKAEHEGKLEDKAHERAGKEIDRRLEGLNKLIDRIMNAKRIDSDDKSSLSATITAQINALTALKAKIDADTSTTTLKEDVQSITKSYRIFALVMPQASIMASADRVKYVADQLSTLSAKLKTRLDALTAGGTDVSASVTLLADMNAKIASAKTQAQAAIDSIVNLKPDNGDKTIMESNLAALKAAREKVRAAQADLKTAREDARKIMGNIKGKGEVHASTTTSI